MAEAHHAHHHHGPAGPLAIAAAAAAAALPSGTIYTCPMHAQIRRAEPGSCPICGMALEPVLPALESGPSAELRDMARRFWIGGALTLPLLAWEMGAHLPGVEMGHAMPMRLAAYVQFALGTPAVLWAGWPFFQRGWRSLVDRALNMFTLIATGTGAAYVYSVLATLWPGAFPSGFRRADGTGQVYFEAAAVITVLALLGQVLELRARERTGDAIRALMRLAPKVARRLKPDGTDEEVPVEKAAGAKVIAGRLNTTGSFVMQATKVGAETMLARIVALVAEAQRSVAPIQGLADKVSSLFVPAVVVVAVLAFATWAAWGPEPRLGYGLVAAVSVLIIACPCALGLATPVSIMVGVRRGAMAGILIRNAEALETFEKVDTLLVDKTGTLTEGRPKVAGVEVTGSVAADEVLRLAASVERGGEHPLAAAIVHAAVERGLTLAKAEDFASLTGKGVKAMIEGRPVALGNIRLMQDLGIDMAALQARADALRADGATVMFVALDGRAAGMLAVADPIKATTPAAIAALRADRVRVVMLTGDNSRTAVEVARKLGIDEVEAEVLPEEKHAVVTRLRGQGHVVAMAGDGVNDAPALAAGMSGWRWERAPTSPWKARAAPS
jgi:Cu+-exporting ATPase